jgi:hypothetical protein
MSTEFYFEYLMKYFGEHFVRLYKKKHHKNKLNIFRSNKTYSGVCRLVQSIRQEIYSVQCYCFFCV